MTKPGRKNGPVFLFQPGISSVLYMPPCAADPSQVFERAFQLTPRRSVVVGIGNLVGRGDEIARYFENRRVVA